MQRPSAVLCILLQFFFQNLELFLDNFQSRIFKKALQVTEESNENSMSRFLKLSCSNPSAAITNLNHYISTPIGSIIHDAVSQDIPQQTVSKDISRYHIISARLSLEVVK